MEALRQDIGHALRTFRKNPVFVATAILALALGIGTNTAVFSVVNTVLLRPLPFPEPDRLVAIVRSFQGEPVPGLWISPTELAHWQRQTDVLEDVTGWHSVSLDYAAGDLVQTVSGAAVSEGYFRALGARFIAGGPFSVDGDLPGAANTVVVSHRFWVRRLNADADIVGKTISLDGVAHTIIGVTAANFDVHDLNVRDGRRPDIWVPLRIGANTVDQMPYLDVFARLRRGVTLEVARPRLAASLSEYHERFPARPDEDGWSFTVLRMQEAIVRDARATLLLLSGASALVLLIVCANVANLLLVRALGRNHEIAVRCALGAGRWRIVRQLLVECGLLTLAGGAVGFAGGVLGMRALLSIDTADLPRLGESGTWLALDWRIAIFTLGTAIATALVFGLLPALVGARTDLDAVVKEASGRSSGSRRHTRVLSLLILIEVGLAVVLVIGAGLLIRTSFALNAVDLGLSVDDVLTMRTSLSEPRFRSAAGLVQTRRDTLERIRSIPGVEVAAMAFGLPLQDNAVLPIDIVGRENTGPATGVSAAVPSSAEYFQTLEIPLVAGRRFDERDIAGAPAVVVINQSMADRYWPDGSNPLGARIRIPPALVPEAADEPEREVIGIVGNVRQQGIMGDPGPTMYFPFNQLSDGMAEIMVDNAPMAWLVRTTIDPGEVSALVHKAVREGTGQPVTDIRLMKDTWALSISRQRLNAWLMSIFGGSALLLGAIGIYGLVAYSAERRRHEIGIRMALGAGSAAVRNMVIRQGMTLVLSGVAIGLAAAFSLARVLASTLFGVEPHDITVFVTVPLVLTAAALAAIIVPAVRASRVDASVALRHS